MLRQSVLLSIVMKRFSSTMHFSTETLPSPALEIFVTYGPADVVQPDAIKAKLRRTILLIVALLHSGL